MADIRSEIQKAFDMVDRRENEAALQVVNEILVGLTPPNRVTDVPPAKETLYDWLQLARKALAGEAYLIPPKVALRSALSLVR